MSEENTNPEVKEVSVPKKTKPEKIKLILKGASSCSIDDISIKKNEVFEIDSSKVERYLGTGLFEKI